MTQLENERLARVEEKVDMILERLENVAKKDDKTDEKIINLQTRMVVFETQLKIAWVFISLFIVNLVFPFIRKLLGV